MRRLILLIIPICIAQLSFSQTDYRKGYVVTSAGDTLLGLVDFREGAKAYRSCDFKRSEDQNAITYQPGDIIGYGFEDDKIFQSKDVSFNGQPSGVVFLEVIVEGPVTLYKYDDVFFIGKDNTGLHQLVNEIKETYVEGRRVLRSTNEYIGTLNMLLFDCAEIREKVQRTRLSERDLTTLIEDYHQCKGQSTVTYKVEKPWSKATIGVTGGASISRFEVEAPSFYKQLGGVFEVARSPIVGVSIDILAPRLSERVSFHGDILYLTSKYHSYRRYDGSFHTERHYTTLELEQLKIPIGFRYTLPERKVTPFFSAGMSTTIHLSYNSTWFQELEVNNLVETERYEAVPVKRNQLGFWGSGGILVPVHKKLHAFLELRYERTGWASQSSLVPYAEIQSDVTNLQILFGLKTR